MFIGSFVGSAFGGPIGSVFGAFIGHKIETVTMRGRRAHHRTEWRQPPPQPHSNAYSMLGASASDSIETLKRKYRALAKANHPDILRAQGASEQALAKATERMSRINAAWSEIKTARGL